MTDKSENKNQRESIDLKKVAALLGILIPIFYAFGYLYDLGYLSEYGLSSEYFTRSHQDYLFKFYYVILSSISGLFSLGSENVFFILFLIFFGMTLVLFFQEESKTKKKLPNFIKNKIEKIKLNNSIFNFIKSLIIVTTNFFLGTFILYALAILVLIFTLPMLKGQKDARTEMLNHVECIEGSPHQQNCTYVYRNKEKILSGLLIARSDKYIAIWNGKKSIVYPIKDEIIVIEKAKKKNKKPDNK